MNTCLLWMRVMMRHMIQYDTMCDAILMWKTEKLKSKKGYAQKYR